MKRAGAFEDASGDTGSIRGAKATTGSSLATTVSGRVLHEPSAPGMPVGGVSHPSDVDGDAQRHSLSLRASGALGTRASQPSAVVESSNASLRMARDNTSAQHNPNIRKDTQFAHGVATVTHGLYDSMNRGSTVPPLPHRNNVGVSTTTAPQSAAVTHATQSTAPRVEYRGTGLDPASTDPSIDRDPTERENGAGTTVTHAADNPTDAPPHTARSTPHPSPSGGGVAATPHITERALDDAWHTAQQTDNALDPTAMSIARLNESLGDPDLKDMLAQLAAAGDRVDKLLKSGGRSPSRVPTRSSPGPTSPAGRTTYTAREVLRYCIWIRCFEIGL